MRQIIDKWLIQRTTIDATIEHSVLRICEGVNENANSNSITFNLFLNNRIPFNYVPALFQMADLARMLRRGWRDVGTMPKS